MRWARKAAVGCLLALAVGAAACGSGPSSQSGTSTTTTQGTSTTIPPTTTSSGSSTTSALNLAANDLPSPWKKAPSSSGPNVVRNAMNHCLQQVGAKPPASSKSSATYINEENGQKVSSQVQVYSSSPQASSAAKRAGTKAMSSCLEEEVSSALSKTLPSGQSVRRVTATGNSVPGLAAGQFSQRVVAVVTYSTGNGGSGGTATLTDVVGFSSGTALVQAQFVSTGSAPAEDIEQHVLSTLAGRAHAGGQT